jgi:hypothetical protein
MSHNMHMVQKLALAVLADSSSTPLNLSHLCKKLESIIDNIKPASKVSKKTFAEAAGATTLLKSPPLQSIWCDFILSQKD